MGNTISLTFFLPPFPLIAAIIGCIPTTRTNLVYGFPNPEGQSFTPLKHHTVIAVQKEGQKQIEINKKKVFSVWQHPRALFFCMHTSDGRLNVLHTEVLFHFIYIYSFKKLTKALYLTSSSHYISQGRRPQEEEKFQKIVLALEVTKLTLEGGKQEPINTPPLPLPYRKSKKSDL